MYILNFVYMQNLVFEKLPQLHKIVKINHITFEIDKPPTKSFYRFKKP